MAGLSVAKESRKKNRHKKFTVREMQVKFILDRVNYLQPILNC